MMIMIMIMNAQLHVQWHFSSARLLHLTSNTSDHKIEWRLSTISCSGYSLYKVGLTVESFAIARFDSFTIPCCSLERMIIKGSLWFREWLLYNVVSNHVASHIIYSLSLLPTIWLQNKCQTWSSKCYTWDSWGYIYTTVVILPSDGQKVWPNFSVGELTGILVSAIIRNFQCTTSHSRVNVRFANVYSWLYSFMNWWSVMRLRQPCKTCSTKKCTSCSFWDANNPQCLVGSWNGTFLHLCKVLLNQLSVRITSLQLAVHPFQIVWWLSQTAIEKSCNSISKVCHQLFWPLLSWIFE
jgi:hypothetical protein